MSTFDHAPWEDERAAYLLDALSADERSAFESHLAGCEACRAELRWLAPAIDVLPAAVEQLEPPPELRARILGAVAGEGHVVAAPTLASRPRQERQPFWSRLASRPALAGLLASAALVAGLAGGYALRGDSDAVQTTATTVPIEATAPAVRASGNVVNHAGTWTLDVDHLPELRPGDVYQVWMRKGDQLIPSVPFVVSRDGTASIVLPGETGTADEMLVTREPSGGSLEPTSAPLASVKL